MEINKSQKRIQMNKSETNLKISIKLIMIILKLKKNKENIRRQ